MTTVSQQLVDWALDLADEDVPLSTQRAIRRHLLDGTGNAIAARRMGVADFAVATASRFAPTPAVSIIGGGTTGPEGAAFANGVLMHGLDFDDTHADALVHVTSTTAPAALALAEADDLALSDAITSLAVGFEAACRIGMAVEHGFHAKGFHATSVVGVIASALVASRMLGLSKEQAVHALGIAGSQASGNLEFLTTGASTKRFHPGWASVSGVFAARLAANGGSGPSTIIEGQHGLLNLYTTGEQRIAPITDGLGERWEAERISIKPYPICQLSHAAVDALGDIEVDNVDDIERIDVYIPATSIAVVAEPRAVKIRPRTPYEAKFSIQWDIAASLIDGSVTVDTFATDPIERQDISELADKVFVHGTDFGGPPATAPGRVIVTTPAGATEGTVPHSNGTPDAPLSDGALLAKFTLNCGNGVDAAALGRAILTGTETVAEILGATKDRQPA